MSLDQWHKELMQDEEYHRTYVIEDLINRVAERIEQYRHEAKMTQGQLAEKVGKRQPHIARIEGGYENITLKTLAQLAYALEKDPEALVKPHKTTVFKKPATT